VNIDEWAERFLSFEVDLHIPNLVKRILSGFLPCRLASSDPIRLEHNRGRSREPPAVLLSVALRYPAQKFNLMMYIMMT
jgi:hypothetical protein